MTEAGLRKYAEAFCQRAPTDWALAEEIGKGNSASVYRVTCATRHAALKVYHPRFFADDKGEVEKRRVLDQMALKDHGHPNLIDFFDAGPLEDTYYLLMEYFPWQSLDKQLQTIDRGHIAQVVSGIAAAAEFLETRNMVHRDIKPANVLVSEDGQNIKLLDLGVMRPLSAADSAPETDHGYALPFVATAQYSSPAYLFREGPATENMWKALTLYQLGAVLHDLLMRQPLFDAEVRTQNRYRVAAAVLSEIPEVHAQDVPPWLVMLARNCLVKDDGLRLSRVTWRSFHADRRTDLNELRGRLGLQQAPAAADGRASEAHAQERLRVRLDKRRDFLIDMCRHVLLREGFPQAGMTSSSERLSRTITFSFVPRAATADVNKTVHFIVRLAAREQSQEHLDVHLASLLARTGAPLPDCAGTVIWNSAFEDIVADAEQLEAVLAEEFVRRYAGADERLQTFDSGDDVIVEVTADED